MFILIWLILGLAAGCLLLLYARSYPAKGEFKVLAYALVLTAIIYVIFALIWGDENWFFIELLGVPAYGLFAWLALRSSAYYLCIGWLLHPMWDIYLHLLGPGNSIAPEWYAIACVSFDILISVYVLFRIKYWKLHKVSFN